MTMLNVFKFVNASFCQHWESKNEEGSGEFEADIEAFSALTLRSTLNSAETAGLLWWTGGKRPEPRSGLGAPEVYPLLRRHRPTRAWWSCLVCVNVCLFGVFGSKPARVRSAAAGAGLFTGVCSRYSLSSLYYL